MTDVQHFTLVVAGVETLWRRWWWWWWWTESGLLATLLSHTFKFNPPLLHRTEIRALWWPHINVDFVVCRPFCFSGCMLRIVFDLKTNLRSCFSFLADVCIALLQYFYIMFFPPHDLLYEMHHFLLEQNSPTPWCCHPHAAQLERYKHPSFSPKCNDRHKGQTVPF